MITAGPDTSAEQLSLASDTISSSLQPIFESITGSSGQPTACIAVKWAKVIVHGIPTGVTHSHAQAFIPAVCHAELAANNPIYRDLHITQLQSWVCIPSSYSPGSISSLAFAFEDPDGSLLQKVIASKHFYAFGMVVKIGRWKKLKPYVPQNNSSTPVPSTPLALPSTPTPTPIPAGIQPVSQVSPSSSMMMDLQDSTVSTMSSFSPSCTTGWTSVSKKHCFYQ